MTQPVRIQRKRTKGFNLQAASPNGLPVVYVGRPTKWGNPFTHKMDCVCLHCISMGLDTDDELNLVKAAVDLYRRFITKGNVNYLVGLYCPDELEVFPPLTALRRELCGKNLACFCPLDQPCHADVLLELSNS